ncbi:MotA/TolQ/ExbB proton channel family protein [Sulfurivermis fontis]|uniref:MotA/TolQ/ExbB proton channel family protein n=1 Tax=Sulfurivermis fontis TaxID=1972068 RepID=UPI000FD8973A|nr:MotA/TolQ/ExbB proton channel family protein [Sulfurivermis fontis]
MNLALVFEQGDWVLIGVFLTLLLMSSLTWYLIIVKALWLNRVRGANGRFVQSFWDAADIQAAAGVAASDAVSPLARLAQSGIAGLEHFTCRSRARVGDACGVDEFLVRTLRNAMNREASHSSSGMTLLASVGSTAPFVGLFGTVWGIYHALMEISRAGSASMEMVAGPLGEALVATAAGLAAAIPAVLAYNAFNRANRVLAEEMDGFAHDLHAFLITGACVTPAHCALVAQRAEARAGAA